MVKGSAYKYWTTMNALLRPSQIKRTVLARGLTKTLASIAGSKEWKLITIFPSSNRSLSVMWFGLILAQAAFPVGFLLAMGNVIDAIEGGDSLREPLIILGVMFIGAHVVPPLLAEASQNLGDQVANHLNERLLEASTKPRGVAHLENANITDRLVRARDFDLALSGPPTSIGVELIGSGLARIATGLGMLSILFSYAWWAPIILLAGWGATHRILHRTAVWQGRDDSEATQAQRYADYFYRMAVRPDAAKEIRIFGISEWVSGQFERYRRSLMELRLASTKLRKGPIALAAGVLMLAHAVILTVLALDLLNQQVSVGQATTFFMAIIGSNVVGFGGVNYIFSMFGQVVGDVLSLEKEMAETGYLDQGSVIPPGGSPKNSIEFNDVRFCYPADPERSVLNGFKLSIAAPSSLAIVGLNGAGKTTIAKLLARLYDPTDGSIEIDGRDLRELNVESWRNCIAVVYQDFIRYNATLRDNVAPLGAPEDVILKALEDAGADRITDLDTVLGRGYTGSTELSGGQWQRIAIARALCAVKMGARVVVLDEPTAQLDVRGEAEIFDRLLRKTEKCITILISHRFGTVRQADQICVVEGGIVVEKGSHEDLMKSGGRYRDMFELQAARFDGTYNAEKRG